MRQVFLKIALSCPRNQQSISINRKQLFAEHPLDQIANKNPTSRFVKRYLEMSAHSALQETIKISAKYFKMNCIKLNEH